MKPKNNEKNPFLKDIVTFLKKHPGRKYKKKEISRAMGVRKDNYYLFRKAVSQLVEAEKITRLKGGLYTGDTPKKSWLEGDLQMTRKGFGFVIVEGESEDIFIGAQHLNTAFDGDRVKVQLFRNSRGRSKEGQIVAIRKRARETFVGTYKKSGYYTFVAPDNPKVYREFLAVGGDKLKVKNGQKVVVRLEKWEPGEQNPTGRVVEVLGFPDEAGVDVASVVLGHGLALNFEDALEAETDQMELNITAAELEHRRDLRDEMIFTIDPPDAKDFDDAISLEKLENGNCYLGVHIADVSYFVKPGTRLDEEALQRGTSIYLVDRVIPMLPEHLSNKLCSLQPHEDRLAFSCFMEIDERGDVLRYDITESVINSKRRFTYKEAQEIIDGEHPDDPFKDKLQMMHQFSRMLRKKREGAGSINFSTPEVRFVLDKHGQPTDIVPVETLDTNEMIEEFMLMANQTVAKHIRISAKNGSKPAPFIYRVHEKPDGEKLQRFRDFMKALGYKVKIKRNITPADFQAILDETTGGSDDVLIKEVALRTMMKAVYSPNNSGHFGLAFSDYTHFTSPIRRYPDLMVHRLLKEYAKRKPAGKRATQLKKELKHVCQISSEMERKALEAERESIRLKQVEWLIKHQHETFEGIVSGVTAFGIFVETMPYLIEGLIRMENLTDDFYIYDEKTYSLVGKDNGRVLRLGDPVRVKVAAINRERNEVDFSLLD